ncbi:MAG: GNAT family N-acetyltransferase [Anaerolineae bacterium]|jgi:predicted N-acetyltransferase YhbS|nr:GNAT family N-acetyltransferase [Anaerolineae bacterium]
MTVQFRQYHHSSDYASVSNFLIAHYQSQNRDGNWIEPAWEYMHFHPALDAANMGRFGIWEEAGAIVAVVHYEWHLGEAFFQFHSAYRYLRVEMLDYAEANLQGISRRDGRLYLCAYVNDNDPEFLALVQSRGYTREPDETCPMYAFAIPDPFPTIPLAEGFRLTSLAEECDWAKVHRVLWRGFDHGDDVPMTEEELESRRRMFDTPKAQRDLKIAAVAPDGNFVAFCGMFYEPNGKFAYVEPVATDPAYRRLGLGKAAVLEGIRRCGVLGATVAYVGSDQPFYQAIGFRKVYDTECWVKYLV